MGAKSETLKHLMEVSHAVGAEDYERAKNELDEAIEIILDSWGTSTSRSSSPITKSRSYYMPGLSGGCTWGDVPLNDSV